jgi:hypothetical protein
VTLDGQGATRLGNRAVTKMVRRSWIHTTYHAKQAEMIYYAGLDVSLRSVSISIVDEQGQVRHRVKIATKVDKIISRLPDFGSEVSIISFATYTLTQYLPYGL